RRIEKERIVPRPDHSHNAHGAPAQPRPRDQQPALPFRSQPHVLERALAMLDRPAERVEGGYHVPRKRLDAGLADLVPDQRCPIAGITAQYLPPPGQHLAPLLPRELPPVVLRRPRPRNQVGNAPGRSDLDPANLGAGRRVTGY